MKKGLGIYLFFAICLIIFFFPVLFSNQVFYYGDISSSFLPFKKQLLNSIGQGIFPLWNPDVFSGYPIFADITTGVFYPVNFLLFLNSTMKMVSLIAIIHFAISLLGMYFLAKNLSLSTWASLTTAIIYSFSGVLTNYISDPTRYAVVSIFPCFALFLDRLIYFKKWPDFITASVILALQIFAGHVQYVCLELVFIPLWILLKFKKTDLIKNLLIITLVILTSFCLTAVVLIPAFEILPLSTRSAISQDIGVFRSFSLHPLSVIRLFIANFWGVRQNGSSWGIKDTTMLGYIGFLPLFLIILKIKTVLKKPFIRTLFCLSVLCLIISFGTYLPFFKIMTLLPIFQFFRNPMSFLALYTFFMSLTSGYLINLLPENFNKKIPLSFLIFFLLSLTGFYLIKIFPQLPFQILQFTASFIHKNLSGFHNQIIDQQIARMILVNLIIITFISTLAFSYPKKWLLCFLIFIDLFIFSRGVFLTVNANVFYKPNPVAEFLQNNLNNGRFFSISEAVPYSGLNDMFGSIAFQSPFNKNGQEFTPRFLEKSLTHEIQLIPPDYGSFYQIRGISGYTTFVLTDYNNYFKTSNVNELYTEYGKINPLILVRSKDAILTKIDLSRVSFNDPVFDKLAVKYIVTDRNLPLTHHKSVFKSDGIEIFENLRTLPRISLVGDQEKIIEIPEIISENANQISLKTKGIGNLIIRDQYYPGWEAEINGEKIRVEKYDGIFRKIKVNRPDSQILVTFAPISFYTGLKISLLTWGILLLFLLIKLGNNLIKNNSAGHHHV